MTVAAVPRYITRSTDHRYTFDGVTYPGTTTVLKVLGNGNALVNWAAKQAATAAIQMADELPKLIESVGVDGAVKALMARKDDTNEKARILGSEVHDLADRMVTGRELPPMSEAAMRRLEHYVAWWTASGWKVRVSEALLINTARGYGGTLDLLCYTPDGRTILADIKTGSVAYRGRLYESIVLQLAAYGDMEWAEADGCLYRMPPVDDYAVIHVTEDGVEVIPAVVGDAERAAFGACLQLHRWMGTRA